MLKIKTIAYLLITFTGLMFSQAAISGGGMTGGSTEITQIANNSELVTSVAQQAQQVSTEINHYQTALQQYMTMVQNLKQLPSNLIAEKLAPYQAAYDSAARVGAAVNNLSMAGSNAQMTLNQRYSEMQRLQLSPTQYMDYEIALAKTKGGIYQQRLDMDTQYLQDLQTRSAQLQAMGGDIQNISGNVGGLQSLAQSNVAMGGELNEINRQLAMERMRVYQEKKEESDRLGTVLSADKSAALMQMISNQAEIDRQKAVHVDLFKK